MERIRLDPNGSTYKNLNNASVRVRVVKEKQTKPGEVAMHEAIHVVAAGEIVRADNIPSGDARGRTWPVRMTAVAAAAPAALGHKGTGWDQFITERILSVDWGTAKRAARSALAGKEEEINEVAIAIEEKRVITQTDVEEASRKVCERRQGIHSVEVLIDRGGKVYSYLEKSRHGEVLIPSNKTKSKSRNVIH